jgi:uncharacterized protein (DUF885 family)
MVVACGSADWQPPPAPFPHAPPAAAVGLAPTGKPVATLAPPAAAALPASFVELRDALLDRWLADEPSWARELGLHEYDGRVGAYAGDDIARRIARLEHAVERLRAVDVGDLDENDRFDRVRLLSKAELDLFNLRERRLHETSPMFYDELFDVSSYIDFDYAPFAERARKLVEHQEAALGQVKHVFANLRPTLSKPVAQTAVKIFSGYAEYLRGDVKKLMGSVADAELRRRFDASNEALASEATRISETLARDFVPRGDDSHVLGRDRFLGLVAAQEGVPIPLAALKQMADEDLARNKRVFQELSPRAKPRRPKAGEVMTTATRMMEEARAFLVKKGIVTLPSEERCSVKESPPYMRWNAAFLNMPGPFDNAKQAYYYITLPDPSWPEKEQEEYIFPLGNLLATTVHETYPGHFVHGLWVRRAATRVQKMVSSYSFTEGWAHYTEQMMIDEGFGAKDPQNRLGQLSDALLRNCRFVVAIGLHAETMTLEQAERRFVEDCFQDRATARQQAVRGTFDPGYFAYTLGKLQILELREEAKRRLGKRFELRRFHDALLGHGAPPVGSVADAVLRAIGAL